MMRILASLFCASASIRACAASTRALLYTSDTLPLPNSESLSISPNAARLLLAQRLGLSQYHELHDTDEQTLEILNTYSGVQRPLFLQDGELPEIDKALFIIEGAENPEDILGSQPSATLSISAPPTSDETKRLALDLLEQDRYRRNQGRTDCTLRSADQYAKLTGGVNGARSHNGVCGILSKVNLESQEPLPMSLFSESYELSERGSSSILYISALQGLSRKDGDYYNKAVAEVKSLLSSYKQKQSSLETTILITPPSPKTSKRSASIYGSYAMPLAGREAEIQQQEEPLSSPFADSESSSGSSAPSIQESNPTALPQAILPQCHTSLDKCVSATNNCSGHGVPYLRSRALNEDDVDCYACRCGKTSTTDSDGMVKTIHWGGPACQKKDVSVPFFLLAGVTIALLATATWGVGLMYSIGEEDLPSVIGAGVAGPRAQK